ncbi:MAG: protein kinase family protein, partial [Rhodospirillaceae bacterium]
MAEAATETRAAPAPVSAAPAQPAPAAAPPVEPPRASSSFIVVRDRFTIYCDKPIPSLDMPNATAYEVSDRKQEGRPLYALVVKPEMPPRISVMRTLKGAEIPNLLQLVDWGVADWPPADRKCVIVIYHRPMGGRVMDSMSASFKRVPDHLFAKNIIKPLSDALVELASKGITHRAIRPDNLYYMDEARTRMVLGDCVTSVPAHDQPVSVEPIESGMATAAGRGAGNFPDDMYAFGATLLMLAVGRDTLQGVPNEEITRRKVAMGSYGTLAADERAPVVVLECLR